MCHHRSRSLFLTLAAIVLLGITPLVAPPAGAQTAGKVLRVQQGSFTFTDDFPLDPQKTCCTNQVAVLGLEYEGLTRLDERSATVPAAAESWESSADGTVLTFTLRENLTYADGSPLVAERFRYAIERACAPGTAAPYAPILFDVVGCEGFHASLDDANAETSGASPAAAADQAAVEAAKATLGVRAVDDRTLEVRLTRPAAYFPTVASTWVFYPVQQEIVEADPEGWWRDPANRIGNGPFRVTAIDPDAPDQRISFAASERYWGGRPKLDGIDYVYVEEPAAAVEAYRRGELDIAFPPSPMPPTITADPILSQELVRSPLAATVQLSLNLTKEPFQDPKVREAFAFAVDRAAFCREVGQSDCVPALSWIPPGVPGHPERDAYAFDAERARQALAASSYGGPENLPEIAWYYSDTDPFFLTASEWLAAQYRQVLGVELTLMPTTDEALDALFYGDPATWPQMRWAAWFQDYPDPQNWLSIYWTCDSPIYAGLVGYCNPGFDALVARADAEPDPVARLALYAEAQELLVADTPSVFLFHPVSVALVKPYVTGYATTPIDLWPGSMTPLTLDLALAAAEGGAATPTGAATPAGISASLVEFVWQTEGGPDLPLDDPAALALAPQDNLWVADAQNSRFQIFAPDGTFLEAWGTAGSAEGQFDFVDAPSDPTGAAAFDGAGNLYVADPGNRRVQKFRPDRAFVAAWGSEGTGDGQFGHPKDIATDAAGRVYVIDDRRDDVQVFAADGTVLFKFGGPGAGDGQIGDAGSGIAVAPDGTILVADYGNHRVLRFGPNGEFLAAWGEAGRGEGQFSSPDGLAVDGQGRVFVADYGNARVQVFDREGRFLTEWSRFGGTAGELLAPMSIAADGHGQVYVGFYGRVQAFRLRPPLAPGSDS